MKLVLIALGLLAWPLVTWWAEAREDGEERRNINRMADSDRRAQARKMPHRRLKYSQAIMPPLLAQRRQPKGQM